MPLAETLARLNALASPADEHHLLPQLWLRLVDDFRLHPPVGETDFARWALLHVNRTVLNIIVDNVAQVNMVRGDCKKRCASILGHFNLSLPVFVFLFGPYIVNSRPCLTAFATLRRSLPNIELVELYDLYKTVPLRNKGKPVGDVFRFQLAANSLNPTIASWQQTKRRKTQPSASGSPAKPARDHRRRRRRSSSSSSNISSPELARDNHDDAVLSSPSPLVSEPSTPDTAKNQSCQLTNANSHRLGNQATASEVPEAGISLGDDGGHARGDGHGSSANGDDDTNASDSGDDASANDGGDDTSAGDSGDDGFYVGYLDNNPRFDDYIDFSNPNHNNAHLYSPSYDDDSGEEPDDLLVSTPIPRRLPPQRKPPPAPSAQARRSRHTADSLEGLSTISEESFFVDKTDQTEAEAREPTSIESFAHQSVSNNGLGLGLGSNSHRVMPSSLGAESPRSLVECPNMNITIRRGRKRACSESALRDLSPSPGDPNSGKRHQTTAQASQPAVDTLEATQTPLAATKKSRVNLQLTVASLDRLKPGIWANDDIIEAFSARLTSSTIGVVSSLTLAAGKMTERGRLSLQPVMLKSKVLLFLNSDHHWVLFLWTRHDNLLQEFNSLPSGVACTGGTVVPDFLRWAYAEAELPIVFRKVTPNHYDCGVYVVKFAALAAAGEAMPRHIDGNAEREFMRQSLLTSSHRALRPDELQDIHLTLPERVQGSRMLRNQARYLECLQASLTAKTHHERSTAMLSWVARNEILAAQQSSLAGIISRFHAMHRDAIKCAVRADAEATKASRDKESWDVVRTRLQALLDAYGRTPVAPAGAVESLSEQTVRGHFSIIQQSAHMAGPHLAALGKEQDMDEAAIQASRKAVSSKYRACTVLLILLGYSVAKYRLNAAEAAAMVGDSGQATFL
ncbi:hypothetical protein EsH8_XV_000011 [Colletotrichum jinshuiense]